MQKERIEKLFTISFSTRPPHNLYKQIARLKKRSRYLPP